MPALHPHPPWRQPLRCLKCLKAVACKANWVYHPVVFLVDEAIDGFIAKRSFFGKPENR
jgi:hypothetical protein